MFQIIVTWEVDFVVCTQLIKGKKKKEAVHLDFFWGKFHTFFLIIHWKHQNVSTN